jgi:hypothetical protein
MKQRRQRVQKLSDMISRHGFQIPGELDREAAIPYRGGLQAQGDVIIVPAVMTSDGTRLFDPGDPIPAEGVAVVPAAPGRHEHRLFADQGPCYWARQIVIPQGLTVGALTVPAGSLAVLAHEQHGFAGIAPGAYVIKRQREFTGPDEYTGPQQRLVND